MYPLACLFSFSFWNFLCFLLPQNEMMSAFDELKEKASKRDAEIEI
jgi:hypothetical protein